jgi:hypothetical protein
MLCVLIDLSPLLNPTPFSIMVGLSTPWPLVSGPCDPVVLILQLHLNWCCMVLYDSVSQDYMILSIARGDCEA